MATKTSFLKWSTAMDLTNRLFENGAIQTSLLFAIGFTSGYRASDILRLTFGDIENNSHFQVKEKKTGKRREIPINVLVRNFMDRYKKELAAAGKKVTAETCLFCSQSSNSNKENKPISVIALNKRIKKIFTLYNIQVQKQSSHTLRKTFAMRMFEKLGSNELALIQVSSILNHSSTAMTMKYLNMKNETIESAILDIV